MFILVVHLSRFDRSTLTVLTHSEYVMEEQAQGPTVEIKFHKAVIV